jgi:hypothetical protein
MEVPCTPSTEEPSTSLLSSLEMLAHTSSTISSQVKNNEDEDTEDVVTKRKTRSSVSDENSVVKRKKSSSVSTPTSVSNSLKGSARMRPSGRSTQRRVVQQERESMKGGITVDEKKILADKEKDRDRKYSERWHKKNGTWL